MITREMSSCAHDSQAHKLAIGFFGIDFYSKVGCRCFLMFLYIAFEDGGWSNLLAPCSILLKKKRSILLVFLILFRQLILDHVAK